MNDLDSRREALRDLVELRLPVRTAAAGLKSFGWDSDSELVTLERADLHRVLRTFLDGILSADDVAVWADAIEGRDDIDFLSQENIDLVFHLANPDINGHLTAQEAGSILSNLG